MTSLEEKKAAARERIEAAAKRRDEKKQAESEDAELRDLEREATLAEALEGLEEKYGPLGKKLSVVHASHADGSIAASIVVKRATTAEFSRFVNKITSAKDAALDNAQKAFAFANTVYPSLDDVEKLCSEFPALPAMLASAVVALCGLRKEDLAGK